MVSAAIDQADNKAGHKDKALCIFDPAKVMMVQFSNKRQKHFIGMNYEHKNKENPTEPVNNN